MSQLDVDAVLASVLEAARDLTGAQYAAVGVLDDQRKTLERFVTVGIDEAQREVIGDLPRGRGILGLLIEDPRPLRLEDVGAHPRSYGFPLGHPPMSTFLGVPILVRGEAWGNLYLTEKHGGEPFDDDDQETILILADWAATAITNARLYRAAESRRDELERVVRALETTTEIARAVGGEVRLDRVLELIVKRARALVEARGVLILLSRGDELVVTAMAGELDRDLVGTTVPREGSVSGAVMRSGRPERLADVRHRLRFTLADRIDAEGGLFMPLVFHGRPVGVLLAFDRLVDGTRVQRRGRAPDAGVRRQRRHRRRHRPGRGREQPLTQHRGGGAGALSLGPRAARRDAAGPRRPQALARCSAPQRRQRARRRGVDGAITSLEQGIRGLRSLITDLRPAALDALGVGAALDALVERLRDRAGAEITLDVDLAHESGRSPSRLPPGHEAALYRITQEALTNVLKHAAASHIRVSIVQDDDQVRATITDDGKGFDTHGLSSGFGLIGMRERLALLGGTLTVESEPGKGTTVHAALPIGQRSAEAVDGSERRAG